MRANTIYLAGGCFWGMQKFFDQFGGVIRTEVGYANGPDKAPTYQQVCSDSGHAETVRIDYDPDRISLEELLGFYFMVIDPLSVNRQGNDTGIQYRTGIYYTDEAQLPEIETVYQAEEQKAGAKLAVELEPVKNFFPAEEYHQKYLDKNPGGRRQGRKRFMRQRLVPVSNAGHIISAFKKPFVTNRACRDFLCGRDPDCWRLCRRRPSPRSGFPG